MLHEGKPLRRVDSVDTVIFSRGSLGCHQATSPLWRPTLYGSVANRYPQPSSPKERRKNPPSSVVAQWHAQLELLFAIPTGWAQSPPHKASLEPRIIFLRALMEPQATKPSRRWQPPRVTSTTGLQHDHLVPLDVTSWCSHTRIAHSLDRMNIIKQEWVRGLPSTTT
jgi:hypothetical protein